MIKRREDLSPGLISRKVDTEPTDESNDGRFIPTRVFLRPFQSIGQQIQLGMPHSHSKPPFFCHSRYLLRHSLSIPGHRHQMQSSDRPESKRIPLQVNELNRPRIPHFPLRFHTCSGHPSLHSAQGLDRNFKAFPPSLLISYEPYLIDHGRAYRGHPGTRQARR